MAACRPKEEEASYLLLNGSPDDCRVVLQSDHKQITVEVSCDSPWSCMADESVSSWIAFYREKDSSRENSWFFVLDIHAWEEPSPVSREAVFLFTAGSLSRRLVVQQRPPDPMREVTIPGVYNAPGGDIVFDPLREQASCLAYGSVLSVRMINPQEGRVVTVAGLPANYQEGSVSAIDYRVMVKGITLAKGHYDQADVIRVADSMVWLRAEPGVYFILNVPEAL